MAPLSKGSSARGGEGIVPIQLSFTSPQSASQPAPLIKGSLNCGSRIKSAEMRIFSFFIKILPLRYLHFAKKVV